MTWSWRLSAYLLLWSVSTGQAARGDTERSGLAWVVILVSPGRAHGALEAALALAFAVAGEWLSQRLEPYVWVVAWCPASQGAPEDLVHGAPMLWPRHPQDVWTVALQLNRLPPARACAAEAEAAL